MLKFDIFIIVYYRSLIIIHTDTFSFYFGQTMFTDCCKCLHLIKFTLIQFMTFQSPLYIKMEIIQKHIIMPKKC